MVKMFSGHDDELVQEPEIQRPLKQTLNRKRPESALPYIPAAVVVPMIPPNV